MSPSSQTARLPRTNTSTRNLNTTNCHHYKALGCSQSAMKQANLEAETWHNNMRGMSETIGAFPLAWRYIHQGMKDPFVVCGHPVSLRRAPWYLDVLCKLPPQNGSAEACFKLGCCVCVASDMFYVYWLHSASVSSLKLEVSFTSNDTLIEARCPMLRRGSGVFSRGLDPPFGRLLIDDIHLCVLCTIARWLQEFRVYQYAACCRAPSAQCRKALGPRRHYDFADSRNGATPIDGRSAVAEHCL